MSSDDREVEYEAMLENLASAIEMARWEDGTSRRALAEASGLSERFIADVEKRRANPSLRSMFELARALSLSLPDMLAAQTKVDARLGRLLSGMGRLDQEAVVELLEAREAGRRPGMRVALLGMRGAGKTTVGKKLARELGCAFIELDERVEARAGLTLAQIFEIHGEPYYRRLEREALAEALSGGGDRVLATGGGLVTSADTYEMLKSAARTVWLKARPEEYLGRVLRQGDRRPVEKRPQALVELKALLAAREPAYRQAKLTVDTTNVAPDQAVRKIAAWLRREAA